MSVSSESDYEEAADILNGKPTVAEVDLLRAELSEKCFNVTAYLLSSRETVEKRRFIESALQDLMNAFNLMAASYLSLSTASKVAFNVKATVKKTIKDEVAAAMEKTLSSLRDFPTGPSYADMTAKSASRLAAHKVKINNGPTVIVPKTVSVVIGPKTANEASFASSDDTKKAIIKAVRPGDINLKVNRVVNSRNKTVRIIAEEMDLPKLKASSALSKAGLEIKERERLNPRLLIRDVPTDCPSDDLAADIISLNLKGSSMDSIKVIYRYPSRLKNGLASVVIETTADLRSRLLEQGRVYLPWRSCKVEDHLRILQCYKCQGFGHLAKNCNLPAVCGNCAGEHETSSCTQVGKTVKCTNCVTNKLPNTEHRAFDATKCPLIKRRLTEKAKNISY